MLRDKLDLMDLPTAEVECPEWGTTVKVRGLTLKERTAILSLASKEGMTDAERNAELALWLVIYGVLDGLENAFSENDHEALRDKNPAVIDRLALKIGDLSKMGLSGDGLEKNSGATQSGGLSSA